MSYKQNKFLKIVKEFDVNGNDYIINGIDTNKAVFFWRTNQYEFDVIPLGSYSIVVEGANTILRISDTATLSEKERIQICYEFASISSEYEVDFNVDINVLKDNYNKAVKDIKNIYDYVKVNMMLSDATDVSIVLPKLDIDEVWVRTEEGYRGLNIGSIETIVADSIIELTNLSNDLKSEINDLTEVKKGEIIVTANDKIAEINNVIIENVDLPIATAVTKGIASFGTGFTVVNGHVTADGTNIVSANDGIIANADNIQLNTINNLTTASSTKPLSANMGKVLNDGKIDKTSIKTEQSTNTDTDILSSSASNKLFENGVGADVFGYIEDGTQHNVGEVWLSRNTKGEFQCLKNNTDKFIDVTPGAEKWSKIDNYAIGKRYTPQKILINGFNIIAQRVGNIVNIIVYGQCNQVINSGQIVGYLQPEFRMKNGETAGYSYSNKYLYAMIVYGSGGIVFYASDMSNGNAANIQPGWLAEINITYIV